MHVGGLFSIILLTSLGMDLIVLHCFKLDILRFPWILNGEIFVGVSKVAGWVLLIVGSALGAVSHKKFKYAMTEKGVIGQLLKDGPYRAVRHPFYLSLVAIGSALVLLFGSFVVLAGLIAGTVILVREAVTEEKLLIKRFGQEYRNYQQETGMFLPRISKRG